MQKTKFKSNFFVLFKQSFKLISRLIFSLFYSVNYGHFKQLIIQLSLTRQAVNLFTRITPILIYRLLYRKENFCSNEFPNGSFYRDQSSLKKHCNVGAFELRPNLNNTYIQCLEVRESNDRTHRVRKPSNIINIFNFHFQNTQFAWESFQFFVSNKYSCIFSIFNFFGFFFIFQTQTELNKEVKIERKREKEIMREWEWERTRREREICRKDRGKTC